MKYARDDNTRNYYWNVMLIFGVFTYGSHGVLVNLSKVDGQIPYHSASVVFFTELFKLIMSMLLSLPEFFNGAQLPSINQCVVFFIPALLYGVNNNLFISTSHYIDPASFQILANLKIITTAFLYKLIIKRSISQKKWLSFLLLTIAGAFNSYGGWKSTKIQVTLMGLLLVLFHCLVSSTASVYTEYLLKEQRRVPLAIQQIIMYTFGILINSTGYIITTRNDDHGNIVQGYSRWTLLIIVTQAMNGLIIGAVVKHASNLTRLIIISGSILVSTSLSILVFNLQFNVYFTVAFFLVLIAMYIYYK